MNRRTSLLATTILFAFLLVFSLMFMTGLTTQAAAAEVFEVNDDGDSGNDNCGDASCTLRDAIIDANASAGVDTIVFTLGSNATIVLDGTQLPAISESLTISGPGEGDLTVSAANLSRIFEINSGQMVTITGMTIRDGSGGSWGGAIMNNGTLLLQNSTVTSNTAAIGGGIYNASSGSLIIDSSRITDNIATSRGGGISNPTGSKITVTHSNLSGNLSATNGGAIYAEGAEVSISYSTLQDNAALSSGGALLATSTSTVEVINSTIYSNTANQAGGFYFGGGDITITNSTLSHNSGTVAPGGINVSSPSTTVLQLRNTVIANSVNGDCALNLVNLSSNVNNLVEDGSCSPDYSGDPDLGPLTDNGGDTGTMMPAAGSPLIDTGDNGSCEAKDQREVDRPLDGDLDGNAVCDIGAVEAPAPLFTVTKVADTNDGTCDGDCSLREALAAAAGSGGWAKIVFSLADNSTITLSSGQLTISSDVTIDGSTAVNLTVSGNNNNRVFSNSSNISTTITSLTISDGLVTSGSGGGISNAGRLALYNSSVINSAAERGGGIDSSGTLIVDGSLIAYNLATTNDGGGINMFAGELSMTNSTLAENEADGDGGGIYVSAGVTTTVNNSTLSGNTASAGGGIRAAGTDGLLHLLNTIIANSTGGDCSASPTKIGTNTQNMIEDDSCSPDFSGDPNLGTLQDNGGETWTLLPLTGSTAIDNGQNGTCEATDQRGVTRPQDGDGDSNFVCDVGAVEVVGTTLTVNKTADTNDGICSEADCSLREAIVAANALAGANKILFSLPASSVITLGSQLPAITDTLTIDGSTAVSLTVSGNNADRVFEIGSGTAVSMTYMTITDGKADTGSTCPDDCGAGILNGGQLGLARIILSSNSAYRGGGVYNSAGATLTAVLNEFSDNAAENGAGIYHGSSALLTIDRNSFTGNIASNLGGGIYILEGTATIDQGHFEDNEAAWGGGIFLAGGGLAIDQSTFTGNSVISGGGGLYSAGQVSFTGNSLTGNTAFWGGGVYNGSSGSMTSTNNALTGNTASSSGGGIFSTGVLTSTDNTLTNNDANTYGGGMYNDGKLTVNMDEFSDGSAGFGGGGVYVASSGVMTMTQATLMHNSATNDGGGIDNWGQTTVAMSTIYSNTAQNGGAVYNGSGRVTTILDSGLDSNKVTAFGGAIYNIGRLTLARVSLTNNEANDAGAVYNGTSGWMESTDVTIEDNTSVNNGGGLINAGNMTVSRNTVVGNGTATYGGGIYVVASGQMTMTNSTVTQNSAGWGGGVANSGISRINNVTVSSNGAASGGGLRNNLSGQLYLSNSIIADSTLGVDCLDAGTIVSNINNLAESGTCSVADTGDPLLQALADNGGETLTQGIPVESPAYNKGDNATCEAKDQRGVNRPQDSACDIGAFELIGGTSIFLPMVIK